MIQIQILTYSIVTYLVRAIEVVMRREWIGGGIDLFLGILSLFDVGGNDVKTRNGVNAVNCAGSHHNRT